MLTANVFSDVFSLCNYAAQCFNYLADEAVEQRGRFLVALSGGSTPQTLFRLLAQAPYAQKIEWSKTHLFFADERCVPADDPESNYGQVNRLLLSALGENRPQVYRMRGELSPQAAAEDYAVQLKVLADQNMAWPRFDLILLGMGTDGHTASLFPGSEPYPPESVLAVEAFYQDRPAWRTTLTPQVINGARQIFFMAAGANKAAALAAVLNGTTDLKKWPAGRVRPSEGEVTWLVDEAAAANLPQNLINRSSRRC